MLCYFLYGTEFRIPNSLGCHKDPIESIVDEIWTDKLLYYRTGPCLLCSFSSTSLLSTDSFHIFTWVTVVKNVFLLLTLLKTWFYGKRFIQTALKWLIGLIILVNTAVINYLIVLTNCRFLSTGLFVINGIPSPALGNCLIAV